MWSQWRDTELWASDEGVVVHRYKNGNEREIGWTSNSRGKFYVRINYKGKNYIRSIIVWEAFNGVLPAGYCVYHKNGCSTMDDIYNLTLIKKENIPKVSGSKKRVKDTATGRVYSSHTECAKAIGWCRATVSTWASRGQRFVNLRRG